MHKHHVVPRHMGGSNHPSNIELVTVAEHAERHRVLFEKHGHWQDELAWKGLAGLIDKEELVCLKNRYSKLGKPNYKLRGQKRSIECRERLSQLRRGKVHSHKTWRVTSPNGEVFILNNLAEFCRQNKLSQGNLSMCVKKQKPSKGYFAEIVFNHDS